MSLAHNVIEGTRTRDIEIFVDVTFESMLLSNNTLNGLKNSGFYKPSPIQLHGIPLGKCGFDLFLEAKSGTGKTAVFTVIALENLDLSKGLQAVILTPTREIAAQIKDVIEQIGSSYLDLSVEVVMGGLPVEEDIQKLQRKVHILVGSPGRLRHLIHSEHVDVSAVRMFVLDEADKLMDKSFIADINYIFSVLPKQKQVIMSSATFPESLKTIMQNYVQTVQHICPDSTSILLGIKQLVTTVKSHVNIVRQTQIKFEELLKILSSREFKQCLIFCNYQVRVGELCKMLIREKWPADQLHGQLEQSERLDALRTLQQYKCRILVSTDLAARGIDASNVDLVINFEPPYEWQTYLHRIGRTGRFGSYGSAITILSEGKEVTKFKQIISNISRSIKINYLWSNDNFICYDDSVEKSEQDLVEPSQDKSEICNSTDTKEMSIATEVKAMSLTPKMGESSETAAVKDKIKISGVDKINNTEQNKTESKQISKTPEVESFNVAEEEVKHDNKDILEILKFEMLELNEDQSLEMTEQIKIESFNDLLASFNVRKPNDDKNIEIQDASFRKCLDPDEDQSFPNSFNTLETTEELKIESFNDLLASFKDHKHNDSENTEIQDANFRVCLDSISSAETEPNIILELHTNSDNEIEVRHSEEYTAKGNIVAESLTSSHEEKQLSEKSSTVKMNSNSSLRTDIITNQLQLDKREDTGTSQSSHNALISAGLPTSFSSTKHSYSSRVNESKAKKDSKKIYNKKKSNKIVHNSSNNESLHTHNKVSTFGSSSEASPVSLEDDGYNTHSCLYSRSAKYVQSRSNISKARHNTSNRNDMHSVYDKRHTNNMDMTSDIYTNYTTWYKLLKTQMKQVEMSLYMNELSKI